MNDIEMRDSYSDFDFIRLTWCDTNGVPRSRVVHKSSFESVLKSGIGITAVYALFGVDSKGCKFPKLERADSDGITSVLMTPQMETFHACPWSGKGKYKVYSGIQ